MTTDAWLIRDPKGLLHLYEPKGEENLYLFCKQLYPLRQFSYRFPLNMGYEEGLHVIGKRGVVGFCPICQAQVELILALQALTEGE